ncbi:NADP-dependent 3-hydroxy acid dehydrogenase YdfG [Promicromonospora umidemergens]|uniref:SDR family oxidoreductase n=1 Tax=Promicromonospora umidemergens TaxID=629679 RepID=A0ABP8X237_9MICO|nr:SDR family NAD(P)-dependent oxidoreductase [Promicromonospora umidemergens]MCP2285062.1 NADP-dependent 3-hydroxy acid dehydrogenase YdfG [Promicromonospora umidemergens]
MTERPTNQPRTWFITGASRGLGRAFADAALDAGDQVAAVSRTTRADETRAGLLQIVADVRDPASVRSAVEQAVEAFGRLDIVINNAGTMSYGFVEEFTEAQVRAQLETNFFGAVWVTQAVAPVLRRQRSGHLIQISSIGGLAGFAGTGLYSASKFALEGLSEAVAHELADFGVDVTIVQPGGYWTDLYTAMDTAAPLPDYDGLRDRLAAQFAENSVDSDPERAAEAILELTASARPPRRLLLGGTAYDIAFEVTDERRRTWKEWEAVSRSAEEAVPSPQG